MSSSETTTLEERILLVIERRAKLAILGIKGSEFGSVSVAQISADLDVAELDVYCALVALRHLAGVKVSPYHSGMGAVGAVTANLGGSHLAHLGRSEPESIRHIELSGLAMSERKLSLDGVRAHTGNDDFDQILRKGRVATGLLILLGAMEVGETFGIYSLQLGLERLRTLGLRRGGGPKELSLVTQQTISTNVDKLVKMNLPVLVDRSSRWSVTVVGGFDLVGTAGGGQLRDVLRSEVRPELIRGSKGSVAPEQPERVPWDEGMDELTEDFKFPEE